VRLCFSLQADALAADEVRRCCCCCCVAAVPLWGFALLLRLCECAGARCCVQDRAWDLRVCSWCCTVRAKALAMLRPRPLGSSIALRPAAARAGGRLRCAHGGRLAVAAACAERR
jgi:hypothetical protein